MSRISRCLDPLYQTRGQPVRQSFQHRQPDGTTTDLSGCSAVARLRWDGTVRALEIGPLDATGDFIVTGAVDVAADIPIGRLSEMWLTITDSQGMAVDLIYPVIGETP